MNLINILLILVDGKRLFPQLIWRKQTLCHPRQSHLTSLPHVAIPEFPGARLTHSQRRERCYDAVVAVRLLALSRFLLCDKLQEVVERWKPRNRVGHLVLKSPTKMSQNSKSACLGGSILNTSSGFRSSICTQIALN